MNKLQADLLPVRSDCQRTAGVLSLIVRVAILCAALALLAVSLFVSARIGPAGYEQLQVHIISESVPLNLLKAIIGVALISMAGLVPATERSNRICAVVALCVLGFLGAIWVTSVKAHAESDGDVLMQIAQRIIAGDYAEIATPGEYYHYFLVRYPYLCGLLSVFELLMRVFGESGSLAVFRLLNVGMLLSSYAALLLITQRLYANSRITFVTLLLLCLCVQPLLNCTFVYGLVPAFALCVWAVYGVIRYIQGGKAANMIIAAALMAAAVYLRSNCWIVMVALIIVLLLHSLRRKKVMAILFAVVMILAALPLPSLAQTAYEERLNTSFGSGYPKSFWMAMSLQKSEKATGWHSTEYRDEIRETYGSDVKAIDARAKADIRAKFSDFSADPKSAGVYLFEKLASMWVEPTFTSIWITKAAPWYAEPEALATVVYSARFDQAFPFFAKSVLLLYYAGFVLHSLASFRRRTDEQLILPLIILGGLLFHLLFEAKSQYVLEYLPLFCPLAASGVLSLPRLEKKRRTSP